MTPFPPPAAGIPGPQETVSEAPDSRQRRGLPPGRTAGILPRLTVYAGPGRGTQVGHWRHIPYDDQDDDGDRDKK